MITNRRFEQDDLALLTPDQMGEADRTAEAAGLPGATMMEAAGGAVAVAIGARWPMRPVKFCAAPEIMAATASSWRVTSKRPVGR
jgi:hypothetical protein